MDEIALEAQARMNKTIDNLRGSLATLRTGRASPAIVAGVEIDYYGSMTPISQISSITIPEPRQLLIKPYRERIVGVNIALGHAFLDGAAGRGVEAEGGRFDEAV